MRWGTIPPISQYVLIFIAVTFTWLMGLMGYVRSGLRQHWHVYGVMRDTSLDAFTPTLGFATTVVSVTRADLLPPHRLRVLAGQPAPASRTGERRPAKGASDRAAPTVPEPGASRRMRVAGRVLRIAALAVAATGFYTYVGQLVPQKEVHPPAEVEITAT